MVKIFFIFLFIAFVIMCFGMRFFLKRYNGWITLEKKYKTLKQQLELNGKDLTINRSSLGGGRWLRNIISFYETDKGLLLTQTRMLRGSQFNILIPWKEIVACRQIKIGKQKTIQMMIGNPKEGQIDLEEKDFLKIRGKVTHASFEQILDS